MPARGRFIPKDAEGEPIGAISISSNAAGDIQRLPQLGYPTTMSKALRIGALLAGVVIAAPTTDNLVVQASTGQYIGVINETFPNVRAFVNVPYGQSTDGSNRFMPPLPVLASSSLIDATQYPPACPQYVSAIKSIWSQEIPQYLQYWGVSNLSAGISAPFASEDCLRLAIWTPANATSASNLPVAMV